jgi:hypothetical protein
MPFLGVTAIMGVLQKEGEAGTIVTNVNTLNVIK